MKNLAINNILLIEMELAVKWNDFNLLLKFSVN